LLDPSIGVTPSPRRFLSQNRIAIGFVLGAVPGNESKDWISTRRRRGGRKGFRGNNRSAGNAGYKRSAGNNCVTPMLGIIHAITAFGIAAATLSTRK
jgi:hypothetical protein